MANELKQAAGVLVLGPEHKAAEALAAFLAGRTDGDAVRSWALSTVVDMTQATEVTALLQMVPAGDVAAIIAKQQEFAAKNGAARAAAGGLRITFSESGRVVLNGLKINQSAEGKGGAPLSLFPAQVSTLIDGLPIFLAALLDNAERIIPATEKEKDVNPAWKAGKDVGKTDDQLKAAGVARFVDRAHKRAGQPAMSWEGCDKPATVAKIRAALDALRTVKPADVK